jgi:hypothetical protein
MAATTTEENPMIRLRPSDDDGVVDGGLLTRAVVREKG